MRRPEAGMLLLNPKDKANLDRFIQSVIANREKITISLDFDGTIIIDEDPENVTINKYLIHFIADLFLTHGAQHFEMQILSARHTDEHFESVMPGRNPLIREHLGEFITQINAHVKEKKHDAALFDLTRHIEITCLGRLYPYYSKAQHMVETPEYSKKRIIHIDDSATENSHIRTLGFCTILQVMPGHAILRKMLHQLGTQTHINSSRQCSATASNAAASATPVVSHEVTQPASTVPTTSGYRWTLFSFFQGSAADRSQKPSANPPETREVDNGWVEVSQCS
jgi:hypothetical protein